MKRRARKKARRDALQRQLEAAKLMVRVVQPEEGDFVIFTVSDRLPAMQVQAFRRFLFSKAEEEKARTGKHVTWVVLQGDVHVNLVRPEGRAILRGALATHPEPMRPVDTNLDELLVTTLTAEDIEHWKKLKSKVST